MTGAWGSSPRAFSVVLSEAWCTGWKLHFHLLLIRDTVCCEFFGPLWMCLFTPTSRALIRKLGQWGEMLSWICIRPALCSDWGVLGFAPLPNYHSSCSLSFHHTQAHTSAHFLSPSPHSPPLFSFISSLPALHSLFHSLHLCGLVKGRSAEL